MSERTGLVCAETEEELEMAIEDGFCLFDSSRMFPGDRMAGAQWFFNWSYNAASNLPGRKLLVVDEVWKYCSPHSIPVSLGQWILDGRKLGCETMFATQQPNKLNETILNESTELVCFRLQGSNALAKIAEHGIEPEEVKNLQRGAFVALNCETGGELRGRLW